VLQYVVAVCCSSGLHCVVAMCVAVCCSVLQCVTDWVVYTSIYTYTYTNCQLSVQRPAPPHFPYIHTHTLIYSPQHNYTHMNNIDIYIYAYIYIYIYKHIFSHVYLYSHIHQLAVVAIEYVLLPSSQRPLHMHRAIYLVMCIYIRIYIHIYIRIYIHTPIGCCHR